MLLPNFLLQRNVVTPIKYHAAGTMLAAGLALQRGWALNLGGGMHHASAKEGMGWCPFDDIMLAVRCVQMHIQQPGWFCIISTLACLTDAFMQRVACHLKSLARGRGYSSRLQRIAGCT